MKISRLPKEGFRGNCDDCHNTAELQVTYGYGLDQKRWRLCLRCGRYLTGTMTKRIAEAEAGAPIPEPRGNKNAQTEIPATDRPEHSRRY